MEKEKEDDALGSGGLVYLVFPHSLVNDSPMKEIERDRYREPSYIHFFPLNSNSTFRLPLSLSLSFARSFSLSEEL